MNAVAWLRLARPQQWYKNAIVAVPLIFSANAFTWSLWPRTLAAAAAFILLASASYALNDVTDRHRDREHPGKRMRPVASGEIPPWAAVAVAVAWAAGGLAILAGLNTLTLTNGIAYLVLQLAYNAFLKGLFLWDAITVAIGFVLRALAGTTALEIGEPTEWLIVVTFLFALQLALAKRRHELSRLESHRMHRPTLRKYTLPFLDRIMQVNIALVLAAYSLYTFFGADSWMMFTLPFAFYGLFRYDYLVLEGEVGDDAGALLRDKPTLVNTGLWLLAVLAVFADIPRDVVQFLEGLP